MTFVKRGTQMSRKKQTSAITPVPASRQNSVYSLVRDVIVQYRCVQCTKSEDCINQELGTSCNTQTNTCDTCTNNNDCNSLPTHRKCPNSYSTVEVCTDDCYPNNIINCGKPPESLEILFGSSIHWGKLLLWGVRRMLSQGL